MSRLVSVVVPHYYPEREKNLPVIINALSQGSRCPSELIIWANSPISRDLGAGIDVITSHRNVGAQARFIAALTAIGDHVIFHDNDLMVQRRTIEVLLATAERLPGAVITADGRVFSTEARRYRETQRVHGPSVERRVDIGLGRLELVRTADLPRILATFPFGEDGRMDDLQFSAACARANVSIFVAPLGPDSGFSELSMGGVGSCKEPDHYRERDRLCQQIFGESGSTYVEGIGYV